MSLFSLQEIKTTFVILISKNKEQKVYLTEPEPALFGLDTLSHVSFLLVLIHNLTFYFKPLPLNKM